MTEERLSRWFAVEQSRIDAFAEVTEDRQPIHLDPAAATSFGGTVAHGFLTLSLLSAMAHDAFPEELGPGRAGSGSIGVNYGFDRVRFLSPVRSGSRVRGRFALALAQERAPGERTLHRDVAVEVEGAERPALVARWITRLYDAPPPMAEAPAGR